MDLTNISSNLYKTPEKELVESEPLYKGLTPTYEGSFKGGTSIKYWM